MGIIANTMLDPTRAKEMSIAVMTFPFPPFCRQVANKMSLAHGWDTEVDPRGNQSLQGS